MNQHRTAAALSFFCLVWTGEPAALKAGDAPGRAVAAQQPVPKVAFERGAEKMTITIGGKPFAEYIHQNPRPTFANVFSPAGIKVTRNFPRQKGDDDDHPHHTGIFLTFGDANGVDFWHMDGKVVQDRIVEQPTSRRGLGTFTVQNRYMNSKGDPLLSEVCRLSIRVTQHGYRIEYDSTFTAEAGRVTIGSKEEGGLAVRVAKPIAVGHRGKMVDSKGREGGEEIWSKQAVWINHYATFDGKRAGVLVMPHRKNFATCWWHARDYGLIGANPFGPLNDDDTKKVLKRGETLRLRFAVLIYSGPDSNPLDPAAAFQDYLDDV